MTQHARVPASLRLEALANRMAAAGEGRVAAGEVVEALGDTGLGLTLMLMMLPVFVTIPGLPVGIFFGFLVGVLGVQIMGGARSLRLPPGVRRRTMPAAQVRRVLVVAAPWLARIERWLRPGRLAWFTEPGLQRFLGLVLVLQGLALAVPIPFGNHPPAIAVVALGMGLMERDGLAILVGLVLSALAVGWNVFLIATSAELIAWLLGHLGF